MVARSQVLCQWNRVLYPPDHRPAVTYLARRLVVAHGRRERLKCVLWAGLGRGLGSRWRLREDGVTLEALGDAQPALRPRLEQALGLLREALADDALRRAASLTGRGSLRWILLLDPPSSSREGGVAFLFRGAERLPCAVLKLRRAAAADSSLEREAEALDALAGRLPVPLRASLPRLLAYRRRQGCEALALSVLEGCPAYVELHGRLWPRRRVERHLLAAADWLSRFHIATRSDSPAPPPEDEARRIGQTLAAAGRDQEPEDLAELLETARRHHLPCSAVHGDFWARNLLLCGDRVGVVDWEHFRDVGSPLEDLFHFALSYGLNYPWSRYRRLPPLEAFRHTFLERNPVSRAVRRYFEAYGSRTGLPPEAWWHLLRLHLLTRPLPAGEPAPHEPTLRLELERLLACADRSLLRGDRCT